MEHPLSHFTLARFLFQIKALEHINLPEYKGAAFRGGFGYAFKKVACALRLKDCGECLLKEKCVYSYIFETPPPPQSRLMTKYPAAPHPFVLCPPLEDDRIYEPGETIQFHLTLIGKAVDYLPYFIYTFEELGGMGIGRRKGIFSLQRVKTLFPAKADGGGSMEATVYSGEEKILKKNLALISLENLNEGHLLPSKLHLFFSTPLRLKFEERLVSDLHFHILFRNLLRRISLLSYFHCGRELTADYPGLIRAAEKIESGKSNLRWYDWERYSTRQGEIMKLGGLLGTMTFSGDLTPFWPYLWLGQFVHVGKGSSFGLGKYEILREE